MKKCIIPVLKTPLPQLTGRVFDPDQEPFCAAHGFQSIDSYVWDETGYRPEARAYAAWDETGLHALLCAKEERIQTLATHFGDAVCRDSCLEWFVQPFQDEPHYINVEVNAAGTAYVGWRTCRTDGGCLPAMPENMTVTASKHEGGWWAVAYTIPMSLIEKLYGRRLTGGVMRGNFYKCDESIHPHFGTWNPVVNPTPDFHRPECFGELALEPVAKP